MVHLSAVFILRVGLRILKWNWRLAELLAHFTHFGVTPNATDPLPNIYSRHYMRCAFQRSTENKGNNNIKVAWFCSRGRTNYFCVRVAVSYLPHLLLCVSPLTRRRRARWLYAWLIVYFMTPSPRYCFAQSVYMRVYNGFFLHPAASLSTEHVAILFRLFRHLNRYLPTRSVHFLFLNIRASKHFFFSREQRRRQHQCERIFVPIQRKAFYNKLNYSCSKVDDVEIIRRCFAAWEWEQHLEQC